MTYLLNTHKHTQTQLINPNNSMKAADSASFKAWSLYTIINLTCSFIKIKTVDCNLFQIMWKLKIVLILFSEQRSNTMLSQSPCMFKCSNNTWKNIQADHFQSSYYIMTNVLSFALLLLLKPQFFLLTHLTVACFKLFFWMDSQFTVYLWKSELNNCYSSVVSFHDSSSSIVLFIYAFAMINCFGFQESHNLILLINTLF